ncbi:hypothetical protein [Halorubrum lipolyticum]|uniref:Uncharacterized protein n=1 Tax=Halorubrum lipolyticum DSM 21995 TaxID=1227482 RepID=M0NNJ6_9EURY|nr:hypothetical protein [Halorubrum lipolyticum]EMA59366.1 hypothetical protein C469_12076 [Halorubrum lipolyticum DSM 21995]
MGSEHRDGFLVTLIAWLLASLGVLVALDAFSPQNFFVASFVGLLSVMQLYAPTESGDRWWLPLRALVAVCFAVFGYVVYLRVTAVV